MRALAIALILFLGLPAGADDLSGPGNRTLMVSQWGRVFCSEGSKVTEQGERMTVDSPSGPIQIVPSGDDLIIQYPDQALRLRTQDQELLVQFQQQNYRIVKAQRGWEWHFPGESAYFQVHTGSVMDVVGDQGILSVRRRVKEDLYAVRSEAGESLYRIVSTPDGKVLRRTLETVEGEPPERHLYLTKALVFQEGPVGIVLPVEAGPLASALGWTAVRRFEAPLPPPRQTVKRAPDEPDPLKANLGGPVTKATEVDPSTDPMNVNLNPAPKPTRDDPLEAKTAPDSEEILRVKDY